MRCRRREWRRNSRNIWVGPMLTLSATIFIDCNIGFFCFLVNEKTTRHNSIKFIIDYYLQLHKYYYYLEAHLHKMQIFTNIFSFTKVIKNVKLIKAWVNLKLCLRFQPYKIMLHFRWHFYEVHFSRHNLTWYSDWKKPKKSQHLSHQWNRC
jgi:hypothetical protein